MKSLDQERSAYGWGCVSAAREEAGEFAKKYRNLAKSAPALIMSNGLMQTLAFFGGKEKHHKRLADEIVRWLQARGLLGAANGWQQADERRRYEIAMQALHGMESEAYQAATEESLELLQWVRRLADSVIEGK